MAWPERRRIESDMAPDTNTTADEQGWCLISRNEIDALLGGFDTTTAIPVAISPDDHFSDIVAGELDAEDEYHWVPAIQRHGATIVVCCGHQISPLCDCQPVAERVDFAVIYRHKPVA